MEIHNWDELPEEIRKKIAKEIEAYTNGELGENPQMLPVTSQDIFKKFAASVALTDGAIFNGYVGAAQPIRHEGIDMTEIGSLWVPERYRGKGIAHNLVKHITQATIKVGVLPNAFCNPLSLGIFRDNGYVEATPEQIPLEAFALCAECPMQPISGCCDTTVVYKGEPS